MARVFLEPAGDEAARKAEWAAVSKLYRQLGKTAPEWIPNTAVSALELDEIRGLFLEDEATVCADLFARKRAGAVLSKANLTELQAAVDLILGVIARATKEEAAAERSVPVPEPTETIVSEPAAAAVPDGVDVTPLLALRTLLSEVVK